jgi:hypothetical protein
VNASAAGRNERAWSTTYASAVYLSQRRQRVLAQLTFIRKVVAQIAYTVMIVSLLVAMAFFLVIITGRLT